VLLAAREGGTMKMKRIVKRGMRRALAIFLMLAMFSAASIPALAFAATSEDAVDANVVCTESVYDAAAPEVVVDDAASGDDTEAPAANVYDSVSYGLVETYPSDMPVGNEPVEDAYVLDIEPASISVGDVVAVWVDGTPANDIGFPTLWEAINFTNAAGPGETIYLLEDVTHNNPPIMPTITSDLTLDMKGYDLNVAALYVTGASLTITNSGGTLRTRVMAGILAIDATVVVNANIIAGLGGVRANGNTTMTVNGNITSGWEGVRASGTSTINVNGNIIVDDTDLPSGWNVVGALAIGSSEIFITGNITATGNNAVGAASTNNAEITVTGTITAPIYVGFLTGPLGTGFEVLPSFISLSSTDNDAVSLKAGYKQFSNNNAFIWVTDAGSGGSGLITTVIYDSGGMQLSFTQPANATVPFPANATVQIQRVSNSDVANMPRTSTGQQALASWSITIFDSENQPITDYSIFDDLSFEFVAEHGLSFDGWNISGSNVHYYSNGVYTGSFPHELDDKLLTITDIKHFSEYTLVADRAETGTGGNNNGASSGSGGTGNNNNGAGRPPVASTGTGSGTQAASTAPKTGDSINLAIWIVALLMSALAVAAVLHREQKGQREGAS